MRRSGERTPEGVPGGAPARQLVPLQVGRVDIDLYLGGDLGHWVLDTVPASAVRQVFTLEEAIAAHASRREIKAWLGNANSLAFCAAPAALSVHYPRLLKPDLLARYRKAYNLHPGYLPWGRGYYPIFWALWEGTPAGATLHEMSAGLDEGPIVAQRAVAYSDDDTGGTLFERVRQAEKDLFLEHWPMMAEGRERTAFPQSGEGSFHTRQEFLDLKRGAAWQTMSGTDLVRLIRCLTFPGFTGLEVTLGAQRFEVHLEPLTGEGRTPNPASDEMRPGSSDPMAGSER